MSDQPRWPKGTPVAPSGRGPGGGRYRSGRDALATPPLAPLEGVTTGIFDRGFADLDEQTQAFIDYRGSGFALISAAAAGTLTHQSWAAEPELHVQARRRAAAIATAMQQSRLPHAIETYRGLRAEYLFGPAEDWPDDMAGMEWTDPLYVSTSANSGMGEPVRTLREDYAGGRSAMDFVDRATQLGQTGGLTHMTIRAPAGTPAVKLSEWEDEAEVLLDRGLRYRIVADHGWETVELQEGPAPVRMLEVEVVPGDWADQVSERLPRQRDDGLPGVLARLVPTDLPEGDPRSSPEALQWARDIFEENLTTRNHRTLVPAVEGATVLREIADDGEGDRLVALGGSLVLDGRPVGQWEMHLALEANGQVHARVPDLRIRGSRQGQGIGTAWVRHVEQVLTRLGANRILLNDASEDEQGQSFWRRMGYTPQFGGWNPNDMEKLL